MELCFIADKWCIIRTLTSVQEIPCGHLKQHRMSITLQYLACWQGREGGSWQAWTWVDRSVAPPWKAPLNALKERENESTGRSITRLPLWVKTQRCTRKGLFFQCLNVHLSIYQRDLIPTILPTVELIFRLNSRAHHECQTLQLLLPWWRAYSLSSPPITSGQSKLLKMFSTVTPRKWSSNDRVTNWVSEMFLSLTWQLWVYLLSHVLWQVAWHLSSDVHQNSGLWGRDLVDEHRARVGQHKLGMVCFKLGTVLGEKKHGDQAHRNACVEVVLSLAQLS